MTEHLATRVSEQQLRQACAELDRRLRAGEPCRSEEYLAAMPDLAADPEAALELIYAEYLAREELGESLDAAEWPDRFPQWRDGLARLFEVHRHVGATDVERRSARDTPAELSGSAASSPPAAGGRRVGSYELLDELDRGGMGVVYRARQIGLDRIVALKMILSPHAGPRERARFRTEAEAAARLQHPNIVQIVEVGEQDGCPWLSMEFVDGGSLEQYLGDAPLPAREAAELVATLARAIHFAHQRGIVHRDLKPANVLLQKVEGGGLRVERQTEAGGEANQPLAINPQLSTLNPKIADFGLAKQLAGGPDVTGTGQILGTPSYMSPEQATGRVREVGPATDVYSLGAILYRLIVGRPPFQGDSVLETVEQIRNQEPLPPRRLRPRLPRDIETICVKCLQKEPSKRYAGADELAADLCRFLNNEPIRARRIGPMARVWRWCQRKPAVAMLTSIVLLVSIAGVAMVFWQWRRAEAHLRVTVTQRDLIAEQRAIVTRERDRARAILENGREAVDRLTGLGEQIGTLPGAGPARFDALQDALKFYEGFLEQEGTDPAVRFEVGRAHTRIGEILTEMGQWRHSQGHHEKGVAIFGELVSEFPTQHRYREYLARSHRGAGHAAKSENRLDVADVSYREAATLFEQLCGEAPGSVWMKLALANTLMNHSLVLAALTRLDEAEEALSQALRVQHGVLTNSQPQSARDIQQILADVMLYASAWRDRSQKLSSRERDSLTEIGLAVEALSTLFEREGNRDAAQDYCKKAMEIRELLIAKEPNSPIHATLLARSCLRRGLFLSRSGPPEEEEMCYRRVMSLLEKPLANFPERWEYRQQLVDAQVRLGRLLIKTERAQEGLSLFTSAVDHQDRIASDLPHWVQAWRGQLRFLLELGDAQGKLGHLDRAAESYARAFALGEAFIREFPEQLKFVQDRLMPAASTHALFLLRDGNDAEYRALNAWMLSQVREGSATSYANSVAWTCALAPDGVPDVEAVVEIAERGVSAAKTARNRHLTLNTLGAALYRANRFSESIDALARASDLDDQGGLPQDWIFLAMAHARLDRSAEAHQWMNKTLQWLDEYNVSPSRSAPVPWQWPLETDLLISEAQSVIAGR